MFALGNATFACGVRSARERLFEEDFGETEAGAGATPTAAAGAVDTPPARKPNPNNLKQRPPRALFWLKLDNSWLLFPPL